MVGVGVTVRLTSVMSGSGGGEVTTTSRHDEISAGGVRMTGQWFMQFRYLLHRVRIRQLVIRAKNIAYLLISQTETVFDFCQILPTLHTTLRLL